MGQLCFNPGFGWFVLWPESMRGQECYREGDLGSSTDAALSHCGTEGSLTVEPGNSKRAK